MKYFLSVFALLICHLAMGKNQGEKDVSPLSSLGKKAYHLFSLAGSNTIGAGLAPAWSKAFLESKGANNVAIQKRSKPNEYRVIGGLNGRDVYIDIDAHGSSTGFKALKAGTADIAMASRPIKDPELQGLAYLGDLTKYSAEHVVAIDGVAIIVHPSNPINDLSVEEVAKVFSGAITNWRFLGGQDQSIVVFSRDNNSGTWDTFNNLVLKKKRKLSKKAQRLESSDELSDRVSSTVGAIGFVGLSSVRDAKALAVGNGEVLLPSKLLVATEDYPLARRLFLYTPESIENPYIFDFINFSQQQEGQEWVEKLGFISQNPIKTEFPVVNGPESYRVLSENAKRLSVNFRFQVGSAELDNKAKRDIQRLSGFFKETNNQGLHIQLVGFSDRQSRTQLADVLSRLRATAVKLALFKYGVTTEQVEGFGADLPVASSGGHQGNKNNRVEVWVYGEEEVLALIKQKELLQQRSEGWIGMQ